jgi:3'-phosphoadenosine 5'-phosphosulfate sulfotransferase (PAPS reductase)/FAD synthetase
MDAANTNPALADFDFILINTSAGKDSQAMMDVVVGAARAAGVESRLVAVHADLGRVEWAGTKELAAEHAAHYGLRFEVVSRKQGDLLDHISERGMFPSSTTRFCTSDHKRDQVARLYTQLAKEGREAGIKGRPVRILNAMGFRAEESPARAKRAVLSVNRRASNSRKEVVDWNPIHTWKEAQVWERIEAAGTRPHRAYALGMPRLSCVFCVFAPKSALLIAGRENRALLAEYAALETRMGHQFRGNPTKPAKGDISLVQILEEVDAGAAEGMDRVEGWGNQ